MYSFLSATYANAPYYAVAALVFGCAAAVIALALVFGLRSRRHVKAERVTELPTGLSPLDVQRIMRGRTSPRRLTRALVVWWAERGYITVENISGGKVKIKKKKDMPPHDSDDGAAVFYDRGTYVCERDLFRLMLKKARRGPISLRRSLFTSTELKNTAAKYAVREDDGVFPELHYKLKILVTALSVLPLMAVGIWCCVSERSFMPIIFASMSFVGLYVLRFVQLPAAFKALWCGGWLGGGLGGFVSMTRAAFDPLGTVYASIALVFLGGFFLIRFVDYRGKLNLREYSMLVNYRKFLLFSDKAELAELDYCAALPDIYALGIKPFVKRKFKDRALPEWYTCGADGKGVLL